MIEREFTSAWILAGGAYRVGGRFDHGRPIVSGVDLLLLAAVMGVLFALVYVLHRVAGPRLARYWSNRPAALFRELCRAHGLAMSHRRLLKRLAAARRVSNPALLFVEPALFNTSNLPHSLKNSADEIAQLRDHLFGGVQV